MRTRTHRLTILTAALAALNGPGALPATEYRVSDFLPLAVGNSWTCGHRIGDPFGRLPDSVPCCGHPSGWPAWDDANGIFTLTVERTEEIDGKIYYVLSDIPTGGWPPVPPHFIGGKKLRWEGTRLMEHTGTNEQTLLNFGGSEVYEYEPIPGYHPVPRAAFGFPAPYLEEWWETVEAKGGETVIRDSAISSIEFIAKYGFYTAEESVELGESAAFTNEITGFKAALIESAEGPRGASGEKVVRTVSYYDASRGLEGSVTSSVRSSSWGQVKEGSEIRP